ncbi:MAG: UDP-N-acetylglucosamine 2-epimerase (non-hydrolyzing) [Proteobacteria bacterium]|nr:UDP-N-acetylglucosamine 2-epimerase (non-hydrolyzing) [Pseudomonadota bacterium]
MNKKAAPRILLSMGTRPEIIKMAPVYLELKRRGVKPLLVHTGQHGDMAEALYDLFGMKPDVRIDLKREKKSIKKRDSIAKACDLSELGSALLTECSKVLSKLQPTAVLVHGDTSSALMMALASYYFQLKIGHVEAGLRSFDEYHPFPEEKNRMLIGQLAHWHFAPTKRAVTNLQREGVHKRSIHLVGNTIVQAAHIGYERFKSSSKSEPLVEKLKKMKGKRIVLLTAHRRENHKNGIHNIAKAVRGSLQKHKDLVVVWPVHPNPKVQEAVKAELGKASGEWASRLYLTEPQNYPVLLWILKHAWLVMTDSGGIQEEAVAMGAPVLVLRETTERMELIDVGAGKLVGSQTERLLSVVEELYTDASMYKQMKNKPNPFGDLKVAEKICDILLGSLHA